MNKVSVAYNFLLSMKVIHAIGFSIIRKEMII